MIKRNQQAGICPICNSDMQFSKKELLEKLNIKEEDANQGLTEKDIKDAYKNQAHIHHPDKGGDPHIFQEINEAKEELIDMINEDLLDINPIGDALERQKLEDAPPPPKNLSLDQLKEVVKSINNLKKARAKNPKGPCPYCKKRPRR